MLSLAFFVTKSTHYQNGSNRSVKIIQKELKDKFDDLAKSQGYVSSDEYEALNALAKRLEKRLSS